MGLPCWALMLAQIHYEPSKIYKDVNIHSIVAHTELTQLFKRQCNDEGPEQRKMSRRSCVTQNSAANHRAERLHPATPWGELIFIWPT